MATWNDKQLAGHKRAQSYISSAGATLGVAALGAAGLKTKRVSGAANRAATKLTARTGSKKRAGMLRAIPKAGNATSALTTGSAGVGGLGGYNFAAIQSQEAKRSRVKKNEESTTMDFGTAGTSGVNLEDVAKSYRKENALSATARDYHHKKTRGTRAKYDASSLAAGAGTFAGLTGVNNLVAGGGALYGARQAGIVASPSQLKAVRRYGNRNAALAAGGAAAVAGGIAGGQKYGRKLDQERKNRGRSTRPLVKPKQTIKKDLTLEAFAKAYDPESKRGKRLQNYERGAAFGGGAAAGAGSLIMGRAANNARKTVKGNLHQPAGLMGGKLKPMIRSGAKGAALTAAGVGGMVASEKLKGYRKGSGNRYKALRG